MNLLERTQNGLTIRILMIGLTQELLKGLSMFKLKMIMLNSQLLLTLVEETQKLTDGELITTQDSEGSILMKSHMTLLNSQMWESEITTPIMNSTLGTQETEDTMTTKLNLITPKLQHQILLLLFQTLEIEILDNHTHLMTGIQEIEDTTISKINSITSKLFHQDHTEILESL